MKHLLPLLLLATGLLFANQNYAQFQSGAVTATGSGYAVTKVTDYQSLGVNPANLGWKRNAHDWNLGFIDVCASVYSEPLTKEQVNKDLFGSESKEFPDYEVDPSERFEAIDKFTDARLMGTATVNVFGISYQSEDFGGIAFSIKSKLHWNSKLNNKASRFLFLGYNDETYFEKVINPETGDYMGEAINPQSTSILYNPSNLEHIWYNEYILGYGRQIIDNPDFDFFAGIDIKYITGYGMVYVDIPNSSTAIGYQALSPFYKVDYGDNETPSQVEGDDLKTVGNGFGLDLGFSFLFKDKLMVSLAANDIGSIKWDGNVYEGTNPDVDEIESAGLSSYNIFAEAGDVISDNTNVGEWQGLVEKKVSLPANLRFGASYRFDEQWEIGTDILLPMKDDVPGSYKEPVFAFGTTYDPATWLQLSAGVLSGGQFGFNMPLGATFRPFNTDKSSWEIGLAVRDIISVFKTEDVTVSYCIGFLRFSFGNKTEARFLDSE